MKKDFKYPILSSFFDADNIPCCFLDELTLVYPNIKALKINYSLKGCDTIQPNRTLESFCWDISHVDGSRVEIVLAMGDAQIFVDLYNRIVKLGQESGFRIKEVGLEDVTVCTVCDKLLMPDDECYVDNDTDEPLCDDHSQYIENTNAYHKVLTNYEKLIERVVGTTTIKPDPENGNCHLFVENNYSVKIYIDKDVWSKEIEEHFEVNRGEWGKYYYLIDDNSLE